MQQHAHDNYLYVLHNNATIGCFLCATATVIQVPPLDPCYMEVIRIQSAGIDTIL